MTELDNILKKKLWLIENKKQKREIVPVYRHDGVYINRNDKELISFCCNDYLGLAADARVNEASRKAIEKYGCGAGASRLVSGDCELYTELEGLLAEACGTEAACVFGSGYLANIGIIPAIVGRHDLIITDRLVHACIIDAARISGADMLRFSHNNIEHCRMLLAENRADYQNCLIISEKIFSMDGDMAHLDEFGKLAREYNAFLMADCAHNTIFFRDNIFGEYDNVSIKMGTLSKAIGGYGGYVCGSKILIDYLRNSARSFIFSTGLPPAVIASAIEALKIIKDNPNIGEKPIENARIFTDSLGLPQAQSTIVPLVLQENEKTLEASKLLAENGFLVSAIRPPTVPENTARLRFTFSALHNEEQIVRLCNVIKKQGWI
ncbi:MAG: aminotransferase class I/II-fold pyridoxal phosphate-dependent enzyme [Rickettsiales bacterium]